MVRAAVARAPYAPALWDCLGDGRTQHLRIGERDVFGQRLAIWCERDCIAVYATNAAAPIDERIEHHRHKLVHQLERGLLRAGRHLPGKLRQRVGCARHQQIGVERRRRPSERGGVGAFERVTHCALVLGQSWHSAEWSSRHRHIDGSGIVERPG